MASVKPIRRAPQGTTAVAQPSKALDLFVGHDERPALAILLKPDDPWGADELDMGAHREMATSEDIAREQGRGHLPQSALRVLPHGS